MAGEGSEPNLAAGCAYPQRQRTTPLRGALQGWDRSYVRELLAPEGGEARTGLSFHCYLILLRLSLV